MRRFVCLALCLTRLKGAHRLEQVTCMKTCFLHAALLLDSQEEVLTKLCSANGRFSVKSFCRGWCMYAYTCTQHGSHGGKYWVNQILTHKNIPEKDKIIEWEPECRQKRKKASRDTHRICCWLWQCERFWFSAPVAVAVGSSCSGRVAFALPFHSSIPRAGRLSMIRKSRKDPPGPAARHMLGPQEGGGGGDNRERKGHVVGFVNTPAQASRHEGKMEQEREDNHTDTRAHTPTCFCPLGGNHIELHYFPWDFH